MTVGRSRRVAPGALSLALAIVIVLTVRGASADDPARPWLAPPGTAAPAPPGAPGQSPIPWRASLMIAVSAALGGAAVWVRSKKSGLSKLSSSRELRVISSVRVGPKGHLVMAGVGDRTLLLGVTEGSVRRIAWLPAEHPTAPAQGAAEGALAQATGTLPNAQVVSGSNPTGEHISGRPSLHRGTFADILRKLGARAVDEAPREREAAASPAVVLAELRRDNFEWSNAGASAGAASLALRGAKKEEQPSSPSELDQQAAGILKRRARSRA